MLTDYTFDPAHDGFGFRNPVGLVPNRTGGGSFLRRFDAFVYGKGLCFGMAAAALLTFSGRTAGLHPPLADLPLTPDLLDMLREYQLRQFHPRTVLAAVRDWLSSGGGRPGLVLGRLRMVGTSPDPHILCFGPAPNRRFLYCFARAHAVVPYRLEEGRVYIYDPNHPRDRERFVKFAHGKFEYGGFRSREGWGITLLRQCIAGEEGDPRYGRPQTSPQPRTGNLLRNYWTAQAIAACEKSGLPGTSCRR